MNATEGFTLLLGAIVAWIAYRQYHTENSNLRLSLFERRLAIYQTVAAFITKGVGEADYTLEEIFAFSSATSEAEFLFAEEVPEYIKTLREKAIRLRSLNDRLHEQDLPVGEERNQVAEENDQVLKWLLKQIQGDVRKHFAPYLTFGHVK